MFHKNNLEDLFHPRPLYLKVLCQIVFKTNNLYSSYCLKQVHSQNPLFSPKTFYLCLINDITEISLKVALNTISLTLYQYLIIKDWLIDWFLVFNATFSNISVISWRPVLVVEEAGIPRENHQPSTSNW